MHGAAYTYYAIDMYIRTTSRTNKDGSVVRYVQLAHNEWDPVARRSRVRVLFNLGREEHVDRQALERLVGSISHFLDPSQVVPSGTESASEPRLVSSKPMGAAWVLDALWRRLGIQRELLRLLQEREFQAPVERAIFAMVANRAMAPMSKLAIEDWVRDEDSVPGLPEVPVHNLYRAMDFLVEASEHVQKQVFFSAADLLNLEVDLLYFDTTSTYFSGEPDEPGQGLKRYGHSKDHRPELPQVVIGLAVTRSGIPVRCWVWPGNTNDMTVVKQVKDDLVDWKLGRVITVVDRGFASEENLKYLQRTGGHYIAGQPLRSHNGSSETVLVPPGRYKVLRRNLHVKEVVMGDGEARKRYVVAYNPESAKMEKAARDELLESIRQELQRMRQLKDDAHDSACRNLMTHDRYGRFVKIEGHGRAVIDQDRVEMEERLDGKFLIGTSDDTLSVEDVAFGYKQLLEVEQAFRTLKNTLEIRPIYHRLDQRIQAHVLLCWLALLLIRVAETKTGQTWCQMRHRLQMMHAVECTAPNTRVRKRTEITSAQRQLFEALQVEKPPFILDFSSHG